MIVSVAIVSRSGLKPLIVKTYNLEAQQSTDIMISFSKGFVHDTSFFETAEYRFLYQPIDLSAYVVLVSERFNNVVQDLEVLGLLAECLTRSFPGPDAENPVTSYVSRYERVLFTIDEVVSFGVPNLPLTAADVTRRLAMYSVVEEMEKEERKVKEDSARKFRREREMEQQKQKAKDGLKKVVGAVRDITKEPSRGMSAIAATANATVSIAQGQGLPRRERESEAPAPVTAAPMAPRAPVRAPAGPAPAQAMTFNFTGGDDAWE